jgi:hypothetical protein
MLTNQYYANFCIRIVFSIGFLLILKIFFEIKVEKMKSMKSRLIRSATVKESPIMLNEEEQNLNNQPSVRNIIGFIEKYDRSEIQEVLSAMTSNWLLSLDDFKLPYEQPKGEISHFYFKDPS